MKYLIALLIVVIISLAGALAYFVGRSSNQPVTKPSTAISPTPAVETNDTTIPTPTKPVTQVISGGGILSFPRFEVTAPADWTFSRESQTADDERITIKGDIFTITILQGGFGGSTCLFPGDPDLEGPSARYDHYQEITTQSNDRFRRVWNDGPFTGYGLCQLTQYGWNAPTLYGHISIEANQSPTNQELATLDALLTSFTKK